MTEGYNLSMLAVLIADKNAHMRRILRGILRELNVRMVTDAPTVEEAVKLLAVKPIDLAFVEWAPDFDGNAIVRQTRRNPKAMSRMIPIIVTSAYTEVKHVIASRDAGSDQFLAKPFTARMIYDHFRNVIENQQPFVRAKAYIGPSRRRKQRPPPDGLERRGSKPKETTSPSDSTPSASKPDPDPTPAAT